MHGLGNDFVVFDFTKTVVPISKSLAAKIADRHFGVGCDQILIVENSSRPEIDFKYRILNADGGEVEQCGNGARCFAVFVRDKGLTTKNSISVETLGGDITLTFADSNGQVIVDMGTPQFAPELIPIDSQQQQLTYSLSAANQTIEFAALSMGNPHAVITVTDVEKTAVNDLGSAIESHAFFPQRVNVGFMQIVDRCNIRLRVYERGVGETIACGTGACAAVASGINSGVLDSSVTAHLVGGDLSIHWDGGQQTLTMKGPTATVFHGELEI